MLFSRFQKNRMIVMIMLSFYVLASLLVLTGTKIPENPEIRAAFIGAIIAFLSSLILNYYSFWFVKNKKIQSIEDEILTNFSLITYKLDTVKNILSELKEERILSGRSVPTMSHAYDKFFMEVFVDLPKSHRERIHVIYERLKVLDSFVYNFDEYYISMKSANSFPNLHADLIRRLEEVITGYTKTKSIILEQINSPYKEFIVSDWDKSL